MCRHPRAGGGTTGIDDDADNTLIFGIMLWFA
jgi:hypothetical protein